MSSPTRISDVLPLSPLQSGLFFHATAGGADVYRYQLELEIDGQLDPGLLRRCADKLVERHPALRTAFLAEETDEPVGVVLDGLSMPWQQVDLSGRPAVERPSALRALVVGERTRPFPLDRAPLMRLLLVQLGEARFKLVLTNHHIVLDGWSVPVLLRELFTLYGAGGDPSTLPPARPFRDYLAWLAAQDQDQARARWRIALAELAGPSLLAPGGTPADLPVRRPVPVDQELSARLVGLAREHGVTVNTVLQVLWGLVLGTLTGRRDVVFGATVTGRPAELAGADTMVGLFINTVPVRIRLAPGETVAELLARVQREQARLLDAQYLGLAELQRDAGYAPLFDTLMVFESYPSGGLDELLSRVGLAVRPGAARDATHYPLVLVAAPGEPLSVALKYQPGALSTERVDDIAARFVDLAWRLTEDPGRRLAALPTLTRAEAGELVRWNDTAAPVTDATLVDLVARMVTANPDAPAVRWAGGGLTYRELDRRANRLAHRLRNHGVDAEARVGLHLPRSPELVVAMLAVLKAGGAFVPLEPDWPPPRVQAVAADAGVVAVCAADAVELPLGGVPVIRVDPAEPGAEAEPADPDTGAEAEPGTGTEPADPGTDTAPARRIDGEQLAYVIYTSGSTGTPKGAMIRHRSIANRMTWQAGLLGFGPGDAALFKAPLAFDISINEIFLPLTTGAALVIAPPGAERDVESLVELITEERVSFCYLVASMLAAMLELPGFSSVAPRHVWCGGELLTPELFARFRAEVGATMYHGYGPAEATVGVTHEVYRAGLGRDGPTIGRPNPNTRIQVLDEFLRQTPPGVVGELYIGGLLLGRGYVGDPRRTAERFVADPLGAPGERLYRTGDLAAWLPDGRLRFAGRADNQVKIRGMRVEPEEIESVLATHPAIARAAVIAPTDGTGAPRLVGFYTARGPEQPPVEELRRWLRARLAEHMVPAELVAITALPSQPSGKVDRRALERSVPAPRASATEARTPTEATLLKAFRAVLAREDFGVTDDFFTFGGYSLLATRLVLALRTALDTPLAVRALFDHPTVADLAEYLDGARSDPARLTDPPRLTEAVLLPLGTRGSGPPLFCVHPVSGLALAYAGLLRGVPDRPVYGLQAHSLASDTDLPADLDAMAARYVSEVRAVQPAGPYHLLGWSLGGTVAHLMACQLAAEGERVDTLALLDSVPGRFLGEPDSHWSVERGLAQLLKVSGYRVGADEVDPASAIRLVAEGDGGLSGFTGDDLCNVVLSWRHSSGLRATAAPVYPGELVLFEATRGRREVGLAQLWQPGVSGPIRVHPVPVGHWEMAQPGALDQVAAVLRALVGA